MTPDGSTGPDPAVRALTWEIPNYSERLAADLRTPVSHLWETFLAAAGRMVDADADPGSNTPTRLGVVDAEFADGSTRFQVWADALRLIIDILGDPVARYRTGRNAHELRAAVDAFFVAG